MLQLIRHIFNCPLKKTKGFGKISWTKNVVSLTRDNLNRGRNESAFFGSRYPPFGIPNIEINVAFLLGLLVR